MRSIILWFCVFIIIPNVVISQTIQGTVYEIQGGQELTLPGVNVYWANSQIGIATDENGHFNLFKPSSYNKLVFSFVGYLADTLIVTNTKQPIKLILKAAKMLDEVQIIRRQMGTHIDRMDPVLTENITGAELCKAACCNLAESFETNASVDSYYSNALTGAKQIRLLGLDGTYVQLLTENIPTLRGLATSYGLGYIPGTWMEAIQISKGTASVKNGYESVTGQINVEYLKPHTADKVFLNSLVNNAGKREMNALGSIIVTDKLSTLVLTHFEDNSQTDDHQSDGFLDHPYLRQYNILNRWYYTDSKFHIHFGLKVLVENRTTGQVGYERGQVRDPDHPYGIGINTNRYEAFYKMGYTFNNPMNTNFGSIYSVSKHNQNSFFGIREYDGEQMNYYVNLMFQTDVFNNSNTITTGYSMNYDDYSERLDLTHFLRKEVVHGLFTEYTYKQTEGLIIQSGVRLDYHNLYGLMFTPRIHARYGIGEHTIFRLSAGKGYRTPNVLAENNHFLANSRQIMIADDLRQEEAWNFGINVTRYFSLGPRQLTANIDVYRTSFVNQIIVDLDTDINKVMFYNLDGESFANNYQIELAYEIIRGLDARAAFRYSDVQYTWNGGLVDKPLVSKYKGLITMSYATPLKKWQFDLTTQFNGPGRIPSTAANPEQYRADESFDPYTIINAQITKNFKIWSLYLGVENLTNFTQANPILAANQPFGEYFDGSLIWGPLHGRKIYIGMRFGISRDE